MIDQANPFLGVSLHALGGLAAASFYIPYKQVRGWKWESFWLTGGIFSWLAAPWIVALITTPDLLDVLAEAPLSSIIWCYIFGCLWGIGGLTFGLSMRYLGMSLGYAIALGFCAVFGTLIPPIFQDEFLILFQSLAGQVTLFGILVCVIGIALCGWAGIRKEREVTDEAKQESIKEFDFVKGLWVALFAGVMSACMAFGIAAGKPIAQVAIAHQTPNLWQNSPVFVVVLAGGLTTNLIWCLILNFKNKSAGDYLKAPKGWLLLNYLFCAIAGVTWYMQFLFYGMGTTQMGAYDFSSWTLHMAFIIIFSNIWGWLFHEWKSVYPPTKRFVWIGIFVLIVSTIIVGIGNYLAS